MNPALSVIFFTTVSGAGYGMLALLGVLAPLGWLPEARWFAPVAVVIGLGLTAAGLLSSTLHLGRPERAWRAISQWRSSWLAREGACALVLIVPALVYGFMRLFFVPGAWIAGLVMSAMAVLTVCCTAMIYASLKPIRQWNNGHVLPDYLLFALFSGGTALAAVAAVWAVSSPLAVTVLAAILGVAALVAKLLYWRAIDGQVPTSTPETATSLGGLGRVRVLEAPHTEENYLLREMGFRIARKHAQRLRVVAEVAGFGLPVVLLVVALAVQGWVALVLLIVAALVVLGGLFLERWLFFAEATHTVMLYYGGRG